MERPPDGAVPEGRDAPAPSAGSVLRRPFFPFLAAWVPPLFVWSAAPAAVDPRDVLAHVVLGSLLAGAALALFRRWLDPGRAGLAAALAVVGLTWHLHPLLALLFPVLGLPPLLASRRREASPGVPSVALFLNVLTAVTVATSLVSVLIYESSEVSPLPAPKPVAFESEQRPDVWWIVLDGLSRGDFLERRFGIADVLGPGLERRGFQVAREARANYPQTLYVVASALNLGYVPSVAGRPEVSREDVQALLEDNAVAASFRAAGYRTVYWPGGFHRLDPGLDERFTATLLPTEFHLSTINRWPPVALWRMFSGRSPSAFLRHRFVVATLAAIRAVRSGPPTFSFVHVVSPHAPFVVGPNGELAPTGDTDTIREGSVWTEANPGVSYRSGYAGQATWLQPQVLAAVDRILAPGARPAVVVICSDHGSGLDLDWNRLPRVALADRMSAFWAVRAPGGPGRRVPATMSTVNTFRWVFDEAFGTSLGLLPDRSFWQTWDRPERLVEVTEAVHGRR